MAEYDAAGEQLVRYHYLPGAFAPSQIEDATGIYDVHLDHLQTPKFLTDGAGTVVWSAVIGAFGEMEVAGTVEFNVRFPGQYFDGESGLHYNYFRYYDPSLGRYIQSDPIGLDGGVNTYSYVLQNPHRYFDVTGQGPVAAGVCHLGITVGALFQFSSTLSDLAYVIEPINDALDRVDRAIEECETGAEKVPLIKLRKDLEESHNEITKQFGLANATTDSLKTFGAGSVACAAVIAIPVPF